VGVDAAGGARAMTSPSEVFVLAAGFLVSMGVVFSIGILPLFYGWAATWLVICVLVVLRECKNKR